jgi:hypothetical protein
MGGFINGDLMRQKPQNPSAYGGKARMIGFSNPSGYRNRTRTTNAA